MAHYAHIIPFVRKVEGGKSKAKTDLAAKIPLPAELDGVHTNKGVTWETYLTLFVTPLMRGGYAIDPQNFEILSALSRQAYINRFLEMPDEVWERIWRNGYWNAVSGDEIQNQRVADIIAHWAWNSGANGAVKQVQILLNSLGEKLMVDGNVGSLTLAAINRQKPEPFVRALLLRRNAYYFAIAKNNPSQEANLEGWTNSLLELACYE